MPRRKRKGMAALFRERKRRESKNPDVSTSKIIDCEPKSEDIGLYDAVVKLEPIDPEYENLSLQQITGFQDGDEEDEKKLGSLQLIATPTKCMICEDKAKQMFYGVFSCKPCANFFRKTMLKNDTYKCKGNKQCSIDSWYKTRCCYCRYMKCLDLGMSREAVFEEEGIPHQQVPPERGVEEGNSDKEEVDKEASDSGLGRGCTRKRKSSRVKPAVVAEKRRKLTREEPKKRKTSCQECDVQFKNNFWLLKHRTKVHGDPTPFVCTQCGEGFFRKVLLKNHELLHIDAEAFKQTCKHCGEKLGSLFLLKKHMCAVHGEKYPYQCPHCTLGYVQRTHLEQHMVKHPGAKTPASLRPAKIRRQTPAEGVDEEASEQNAAATEKLRMLTREERMKRKTSCQECDVQFKNNFWLLKHRSKVHGDPTPFVCTQCGEGFFRKVLLKNHELLHKDAQALTQTCKQCGEKVGSLFLLKKHMCAVHGEKYPYQCPYCTLGYVQRTHLEQHMVKHPGAETPASLKPAKLPRPGERTQQFRENSYSNNSLGDSKRRYCALCEIGHPSTDILITHIREVHRFDISQPNFALLGSNFEHDAIGDSASNRYSKQNTEKGISTNKSTKAKSKNTEDADISSEKLYSGVELENAMSHHSNAPSAFPNQGGNALQSSLNETDSNFNTNTVSHDSQNQTYFISQARDDIRTTQNAPSAFRNQGGNALNSSQNKTDSNFTTNAVSRDSQKQTDPISQARDDVLTTQDETDLDKEANDVSHTSKNETGKPNLTEDTKAASHPSQIKTEAANSNSCKGLFNEECDFSRIIQNETLPEEAEPGSHDTSVLHTSLLETDPKLAALDYWLEYAHKQSLTCPECGKLCAGRKNLKVHILHHKTRLKFVCWQCGKGFPAKLALKIHIMRKHTHEKPFLCNVCAKTFVTSTELKGHMKQHEKTKESDDTTSMKPAKLPRPGERTQQFRENSYSNNSLGDSKRRYCTLCEIGHPSTDILITHIREVHKFDISQPNFALLGSNFEPDAIGGSASNRYSKQNTDNSKSTNKSTKAKSKNTEDADISGEKLYSGIELENAKEAEPDSQDTSVLNTSSIETDLKLAALDYWLEYAHKQSLTCPECGKLCAGRKNLKVHILHHKTRLRFVCSQCGKGFPSKLALKIHIMRKHTHEKPYLCNVCAKTFVTCTELKGHMKKQHEKTKQSEDTTPITCETMLRFGCMICHQNYRNRIALSQHVRGVHGKSLTELEKEVYGENQINRKKNRHHKCPLCDIAYTLRRTLRSHCQQKHGRQLADIEASLNINRENNVGKRLLVCPVCQRRFKRRQGLDKHCEQMHEKKLEDIDACPETVEADKESPSKVIESDSGDEDKGKNVKKTPHKCPLCERKYKRPRALEKHCKLVHETKLKDIEAGVEAKEIVVDKRPYKCQLCGRCYVGHRALRYHCQHKHGKKLQDIEDNLKSKDISLDKPSHQPLAYERQEKNETVKIIHEIDDIVYGDSFTNMLNQIDLGKPNVDSISTHETTFQSDFSTFIG